MNNPSGTQERREFFRIHYNQSFQYKAYRPDKAPATRPSALQGVSRNISESGILFQTGGAPPEISSILWMTLDLRTLNICKEIETHALIFNNGLLGRVVRVEENPKTPNKYDVGVCFLTKGQAKSGEVREILSKITKSKA